MNFYSKFGNPVISGLIAILCLTLFSCSSPSGSSSNQAQISSFEVETAFFDNETGLVNIYTDCREGVEFHLKLLNNDLSSTTTNSGKVQFDAALILASEGIPSGTAFKILLTSPGCSKKYTDSFVYSSNINPTIDSDGDKIPDYYEIFKYHTDPYSEDTDGDGFSDFEELSMYDPNRHIFDPRIADLPKMEVEISSNLQMGYTYTTSSTQTVQETTTTTTGFTHTNSSNYTNTTTSSLTANWKVGYEHGINQTYGLFDSKWTHTNTIKAEAGGSYTSGSTYSLSKSFSDSASTNISDGKAYTKGETRNITGGIVKTYITLKNTSNIAYTLSNIQFYLNKIEYSDEYCTTFIPIAPCTADVSNVTLSPGQTVRVGITADLSVPSFESIANNKQSLNISLTGYKYTISKFAAFTDLDFTEAITKVKAKCAFVRIDYGPELLSTATVKPEEKYWISTKTLYNQRHTNLDNIYLPTSLRYGLTDIAGLAEDELEVTNEGKLKSIKGKETLNNYQDGDWYILQTYLVNGNERQKMFNSYPVRNSENGSLISTGQETYNFNDIILEAGNEYHIFYDIDKDGDRVPLNEERQYQSDDTMIDTDNDRIDDYFEIYGWARESNPNKFFITSPTDKDTDGDGIEDMDDPEPCIPERSSEITISKLKIRNPINGYEADLTDNANKLIKDISVSTPILHLNEKITLDFQTKIVYCKKEFGYSRTNNANDVDLWHNMSEENSMVIPASQSNLFVRITAWNNQVIKTIKIAQIESIFNSINNITIASRTIQDTPSILLSCDVPTDSRLKVDDAGYILYGVKSSDVTKTTLTRQDIASSSESIATFVDLPEFYLKIPSLNSGLNIGPFSENEVWSFKLFAYTGSDYENTFYYENINTTKNVTITKKVKGKLYICPFYFEAIDDDDGANNPQYYWTISDEDGKYNFDKFNCTRDNAHEMDDDSDEQRKYLIFDNSNGVISGTKPTNVLVSKENMPFYEFTRTEPHTVKVYIDIYEKDIGSNDDHIGKPCFILRYDNTKDVWYRWIFITRNELGYGEHMDIYLEEDDSDGDVGMCYRVFWE